MQKILSTAAAESRKKTSYENFNVSVYCPVRGVNDIIDFDDFDAKFRLVYENVKVGRVYLECYRAMEWCTKEQLLKVKAYFEQKGIATSGGITTCDDGRDEGFVSLCYSKEKGRKILENAVRMCAEVFDEFIFDDFYFINCRCKECIKQKGSRSWSEFRLEQKRSMTRDIVMKVAKEVNPNVNVIIKFPQWYEAFRETGYDLIEEPAVFDSIYTGTETRNPDYAQQHLPKYLSYFTMRYYESAAPDRNLGGWFDPYECTYNLTSYLEQGYLTLFAKAKEVTLFCMDSLIKEPEYQVFPPAVGQMFKEVDAYLGELGKPMGVAAYRPGNARGEDNLHNYFGMCGIPMEPCIQYPVDANTVFLAEGAADDEQIVQKMQDSLLNGADVIVTSGFVRKLGVAFQEFANVSYSPRKALVQEYADTKDNGLSISGCYAGRRPVLIPQLDYYTNDIWELAAAYGSGNNFPIVLRFTYGEGKLSIITIPDNMGDVYDYPVQVWKVIRGLFSKEMPVMLDGPSGVQLFIYDNNKFIVRSDLPFTENVTFLFKENITKIRELTRNYTMPVNNGSLTVPLAAGVNYVIEIIKG